jgi:hypothetical protein
MVTDILVRVEAETEQEAEKLAIKVVKERLREGSLKPVLPGTLDWDLDEDALEIEGLSEENYSSSVTYPVPDIDLT